MLKPVIISPFGFLEVEMEGVFWRPYIRFCSNTGSRSISDQITGLSLSRQLSSFGCVRLALNPYKSIRAHRGKTATTRGSMEPYVMKCLMQNGLQALIKPKSLSICGSNSTIT